MSHIYGKSTDNLGDRWRATMVMMMVKEDLRPCEGCQRLQVQKESPSLAFSLESIPQRLFHNNLILSQSVFLVSVLFSCPGSSIPTLGQ